MELSLSQSLPPKYSLSEPITRKILPPDPIYNTEDDEKERYGCGMFTTQEDWHTFLLSLAPITIVSIFAVAVILIK